METLLQQISHYHLVRNYLNPLNLSLVHQKEMLQNLIMPMLTLRKMGPGAQERVCLCLYFGLFVIVVVYLYIVSMTIINMCLASPQRKTVLSPRRRSPLPRRGASPRRLPDSPPRRRLGSPIRRRGDTPPRRRPASPSRGRSPTSPPPRRYRSPPRLDVAPSVSSCVFRINISPCIC